MPVQHLAIPSPRPLAWQRQRHRVMVLAPGRAANDEADVALVVGASGTVIDLVKLPPAARGGAPAERERRRNVRYECLRNFMFSTNPALVVISAAVGAGGLEGKAAAGRLGDPVECGQV